MSTFSCRSVLIRADGIDRCGRLVMHQRSELAWRDRVAVGEDVIEEVAVDPVGEGLMDQMVFDVVSVETSVVRDLLVEQGGFFGAGVARW
ncbi:hypothetical protein ACFWCF_26055 [Rhodococcus sp. NPDC060090]|uniref:hypothetical protein n=1 Tax=Rhodococcus sp. NPDC060090 TaxID=3347056 RepID=UPI00365F1755